MSEAKHNSEPFLVLVADARRIVAELGHDVLVFCGPKERDIAHQIIQLANKGSTNKGARNHCLEQSVANKGARNLCLKQPGRQVETNANKGARNLCLKQPGRQVETKVPGTFSANAASVAETMVPGTFSRVELADTARVVSMADEPMDLGTAKAAMRRCRLMVSTDSGPRHVAAALGLPVVTLFGPMLPVWSENPTQQAVNFVLDLDCIGCHHRVCPLGHHRCMRDLTVDKVFAAVRENR